MTETNPRIIAAFAKIDESAARFHALRARQDPDYLRRLRAARRDRDRYRKPGWEHPNLFRGEDCYGNPAPVSYERRRL